tara:strand:- start:2276 stop:2521 length:246 start_codon:yes stop_codon:yes gene_type:complete
MQMVNYNCSVDDMGPEEIKEANRLMWAVKGMLIPDGYSIKDVHAVLNGYFKRVWSNCNPMQFEGFEDAWVKNGERKTNLYK